MLNKLRLLSSLELVISLKSLCRQLQSLLTERYDVNILGLSGSFNLMVDQPIAISQSHLVGKSIESVEGVS